MWHDWTLAALLSLPEARADSPGTVVEQVAIRFADQFGPTDRVYDTDDPRWQDQVRQALANLADEGLIGDAAVPALTDAGRAAAALLPTDRNIAPGPDGPLTPDGPVPAPPLLVAGVIAPPFRSPGDRAKAGIPESPDEPLQVMVELNMMYGGGVELGFARLQQLWLRLTGQPGPYRLTEQYAGGRLSRNEIKRLVAADAVPVRWPARSLQRVWPDFPIEPHIDRSCVTIKSDAARRAFNAYGDGIVWGVVDSGIWADHPHFATYATLSDPSVADLHRSFLTNAPPVADGALIDTDGHGTHVAGIIAGGIAPWLEADPARHIQVTENRYNVEDSAAPSRVPRQVGDATLMAGTAPRARLVSLKALDGGGSADDRVGRVIAALAYVRQVNGGGGDALRIHGVNLSVGYEFDPVWFACGQSPLCKEVDKLVRSGVVVVVAAGNSGYGRVSVKYEAPDNFGLGMTINDPGNAELAITVGSTHRDAPHTYGVSFFSSKGPTGDGRRKPDLLAPGERITSCAAGANLPTDAGPADPAAAVYIEESGTSMAAPHVSGAAAALLSVRREFIGRPDLIKKVIVDSAMDLGRAADFQGSGLLDVMRALQSV